MSVLVVRIPAAKADVETADSGAVVVHDHELRLRELVRGVVSKPTFSWWDQN